MTNVFAAIGQHRDDPDRLLLLGTDGLHYVQALPDGEPVPVEVDDAWQVDDDCPRVDEIAG
ncbi:MAG: hypothetical protein AVDCRST_MAG59-617 [uncultured Thermomicrobiales bacterium]|uniref:Uncharacterized protein n=1 Tax=uncultured Thermomicrobiales bacterium TaxID=1645740 RepID=A0A6J4U3C6_9BACT|nr:MAG: hypothetical protein AVDCRST_MAG59-617 [uncultured Thermomicrobiales bacterium]